MVRGTEENPFRNIVELRDGIIGKTNCSLYTYGTWNNIPNDLLSELNDRKITLVGVVVAYLENNEQALTTSGSVGVQPIMLTPDMIQKQLIKNLVDIELAVDNASLMGLRRIFND